MSAPAALTEPQSLAAQRVENRERFCAILCRVIDRGADIIEALDPSTDAGEAARAYHQVARDIRQGIMLADKLAAPIPESRPASGIAAANRVAARKRIIREVQDTIHQTTRGEAAENLEYELLERLDAPELEDELVNRPVEDIIVDICRDFGLRSNPIPTTWKRRTPPDVDAMAELAAALPASFGDQDTRLTRPYPVLETTPDQPESVDSS